MKQVAILTPMEVSDKYIQSKRVRNRITNTFNIFKIEELLPTLSFPNAPFKNTAHGIIFLLEGEIKMTLNQEDFTINPKTLLVVPAGQMNNFNAIAPATKGYMGTFDDAIFLKHLPSQTVGILEGMLSPEQLLHFSLDAPLCSLVHRLIIRVWELHGVDHHPRKVLLIHSYLRSLLLEMEGLQISQNAQPRGSKEELVARFKKLLFTEIYNHPKPSDFAKLLNVSTNHLNKVLKQATKRTTSQWINEQRVLEAKYLLSYASYSVAEVAYQLGFSHPSHFANFFKQHTDFPPSKFAE